MKQSNRRKFIKHSTLAAGAGHVDPQVHRFAWIKARARHVIQAEDVGLALIAATEGHQQQQIGTHADQLRVVAGGAGEDRDTHLRGHLIGDP